MTETTMERLLSAKELAEHLGVSAYWINDQARKGLIPCIQLGPQIRKFRLSKVEEWIASKEQQGR